MNSNDRLLAHIHYSIRASGIACCALWSYDQRHGGVLGAVAHRLGDVIDRLDCAQAEARFILERGRARRRG